MSSPDDKVGVGRSAKQYVKFRSWLKASATVEQGNRRPTMEDRVCISKFAYKTKTFFVFLLLDGHGGAEVADFTNSHFAEIMGERVVHHRGRHVRDIIRETFVEIDRRVHHLTSGSTASMLLVVEDSAGRNGSSNTREVWIANVGDSTIYGISYETGARKLSVDHNVNVPSELDRITRDGSLSVVKGYVSTETGHMLAVTRAIGDSDFGPLVTAEPTIKLIKHPYPLFALASDGIWDVVKGSDVWRQLNPPKERRAWRDSAYRVNRWRNETFEQHDNTSLILVYLEDDPAIGNQPEPSAATKQSKVFEQLAVAEQSAVTEQSVVTATSKRNRK